MCPCAPICILFLSRRRKSTRKLFMRVLLYERQKKKKEERQKTKDKTYLRIQLIHSTRYLPWFRLNSYVPLNAMGSSSILSR